jgi:predicted  nucleic acid-binding Zn-ribbon protein
MDVKTNKEYTAMLHEIEGVERDVRACEDQILAQMERAESLSAEIRREEADFKQADAAFKADAARLAEETARLEAQAVQLRRERDAVGATLSEPSRELFARVARLRGIAVSEARDEMCQVCRLKLRPQMYVELKHNDRIVQCPSCSRILYYEPPPPTVSIEP